MEADLRQDDRRGSTCDEIILGGDTDQSGFNGTDM
jgi:hypothetical protein